MVTALLGKVTVNWNGNANQPDDTLASLWVDSHNVASPVYPPRQHWQEQDQEWIDLRPPHAGILLDKGDRIDSYLAADGTMQRTKAHKFRVSVRPNNGIPVFRELVCHLQPSPYWHDGGHKFSRIEVLMHGPGQQGCDVVYDAACRGLSGHPGKVIYSIIPQYFDDEQHGAAQWVDMEPWEPIECEGNKQSARKVGVGNVFVGDFRLFRLKIEGYLQIQPPLPLGSSYSRICECPFPT